MCRAILQLFRIILIVIFAKSVATICIEQTCDTLQDVPLGNVLAEWDYVHFSSFFPMTLEFLPARFFRDNPNLRYLTFKRILGGLHRDSLQGLVNLQTIVFQNNVLEKFPKSVFNKHCPKLEKVVVKNCQLIGLQKGLFDNLEYLEYLKIEGNNLTEIKNGDIPKNLLELILTNNQITYIEENALYDMKKLQVLDVSENYLTTFEFKKYLIKTPRIHEIKIGSNYLDELTQLPRLNNLKYFYCENNSLTSMQHNIFEHTLNLEVINLSDNNLREVRAAHIAETPLKKLKKLYLSYNNFQCITTDVLHLFPNLKTVWIGMNNLNCSCYAELENYIFEHSIISLYNYDVEYEKYNVCKKPNSVYIQ